MRRASLPSISPLPSNQPTNPHQPAAPSQLQLQKAAIRPLSLSLSAALLYQPTDRPPFRRIPRILPLPVPLLFKLSRPLRRRPPLSCSEAPSVPSGICQSGKTKEEESRRLRCCKEGQTDRQGRDCEGIVLLRDQVSQSWKRRKNEGLLVNLFLGAVGGGEAKDKRLLVARVGLLS